MDNIDSLLLSGKDIEVGEVVVINHKLDHIFNVMKIEKYHSLISLPVITPTDFDLGDILNDEAIKEMSMYKMACIFGDVREMFINFLNSFTYHKWEFNEVFNEFVAHVSDTERIRLNEKKIGEIFDVAKKIYCIPKREIKAQHKDTEIDNILKEFEEFDRKTKHKSKSNGITLNSIVLAVSTRHNTYDLFNIWDLTVFELMQTYRQLEQNENWDNTIRAIYAGTIDSKTIDLNKIHWANSQQ